MDIVAALSKFKNYKIQFTTTKGECQGYVSNVDNENKSVEIRDTIFLSKSSEISTQAFCASEFLSFRIINQPINQNIKRICDNFSDNISTKRARSVENSCDEIEVTDSISDDKDGVENVRNTHVDDLIQDKLKSYILKLPDYLKSILPLDSIFIDSFNESFYQAIIHIKKQDIIGVFLEGPEISRKGTLIWLCISTSFKTFMFNISRLESRGFAEGFTDILESEMIEKVFHDCRQASDCLFHKYKTQLKNVFDTQVAELIVRAQYTSKAQRSDEVYPLNFCLQNYLRVPKDFLYSHKEKCNNTLISTELHNFLIHNVVYLRVLRSKLNSQMLYPFNRAVDLFLRVLRQQSDDESLLCGLHESREIPLELIFEGIQIIDFDNY